MPETKMKTKTKSKDKKVVKTKVEKVDNFKKDDKSSNDKILNEYSKMELKEHVERLPDTYIGSIGSKQSEEYIYDEESKSIILKNIKMVPGFCNINEEILVNSIDSFSRTTQRNKALKGKDKLKPVTEIRFNINNTTGEISIYNNGEGIDVVKHQKKKYMFLK